LENTQGTNTEFGSKYWEVVIEELHGEPDFGEEQEDAFAEDE
jgi:hypothetical protein